MKQVTFRFSCPECGEPWASTVEDDIDIHGGAMYTCAECGAKVVFTIEWSRKPE